MDKLISFVGFVLMFHWSGKFVLSYSCSTVTIKSPGYPGYYPENVDCTWTKSIPSYYSGKIFRFYINNLDLENCARCACDYVEVFDGNSKRSKSLGKFCSGNVRLLSTGRYFTVVFRTDHSRGKTSNNGFEATYSYLSQSAVCVNNHGTLRTTYSNYGNVDCSWILSTSYSGYVVILEVSSLSFGACLTTCNCGKLEVFDAPHSTQTKIGSWCSPPRKPIVSNGRDMLVRFVAFPASTAQHFQAQYKYEKVPPVCKPSATLEATAYSTTLRSYDSPSKYIKNVDCTWKISANEGYLIHFTVSQLDLGGCTSCGFLQVFDEHTEWSGNSLGTWRSSTPDIVSSGKYLLLKFKTTKFDTNNGLVGTYRAIAKEEVCKDSLNLYARKFGQTLSSRNFPEKYWGNMRCFWHIQTDHDHKIRLIVQTIDFEKCSSCRCDFIEIFDGPSRHSKSLKKWCRTPPDLVSSGSHLFIEMRTDAIKYYRGFKAEYFSIHKNDVCPGNGVLTGQFGTIKSPNFPKEYFGGIACEWLISVPDGKRIRIRSTSLNLESCSSCSSCDRIEISGNFPTDPIMGTWCKSSIDVISRNNMVNIKFISNANVGGSFQIEYETVDKNEVCPMGMTSPSGGALTSLGYPDRNYPGNLNCKYHLKTIHKNQVVRLEFVHFQLAPCKSYVSSCSRCGDTVQATDVGDDMKLTHFSPWCAVGPQPTNIFSSGQNLFLNFQTDQVSQDVGFKATYRSVDKNLGCFNTGTLTKRSGNFSGPKPPFHLETLCTWLIKGPAKHKIELTFRYDSLFSSSSSESGVCSSGYVEVYDGDSPSKKSLGRFCRYDWRKKIKSTGSSMYVTLWVESTFHSYNGVPSFFATYRAVNHAGKAAKVEYIFAVFFFSTLLAHMF